MSNNQTKLPSDTKPNTETFRQIMAFSDIQAMTKKFPNDQDLGREIRKLINDFNEQAKAEGK